MEKTKTQIENARAIENPNHRSVTLDQPIDRAGTIITSVSIIKPLSGTLRGLSLQSVLQWDVDTLFKLLPRITHPSLNETELNNLEVSDLTALTLEVTNFLLSAKQKSQLPSTM
ncbi:MULTISPECIES: phage tail assembly protein [unclassified Acinetobacter]|uniref:phage tail assembly protein n=1 Tax=unclassified Acinetobacter TaxID=196816 RepID=UPI0022ABDC76|nr:MULTISPECIES: phage tail assembly protein [unclassified Acinetobacter]WAU72960.1 phage tail assembly protein [Acinetobacter sp. TR11]WAU76055.1 phage tail assembly protein [Acinetobacter sp. TR3]